MRIESIEEGGYSHLSSTELGYLKPNSKWSSLKLSLHWGIRLFGLLRVLLASPNGVGPCYIQIESRGLNVYRLTTLLRSSASGPGEQRPSMTSGEPRGSEMEATTR